MKSIATLLLLSALITFSSPHPALAAEPDGEPQKAKEGMFVHLSAGPDSPQRVLMALTMAQIMAKEGRDVLVYCDIHAVKLLVKDAPNVETGAYKNSHDLLAQLLEMKVPVRACPTCMKNAGITRDDLRPGIGVAHADEFFSFSSGRTLSISY